MSRPARPALPQIVEAAVDTLGARMRVAVLEALNEHGPSTKADLLRLLGGSDSNLFGHLQVLESTGAIVATPSRSEEPARVRRHYAVDQDRVRELLAALGGVALLDP